ERAEIEASVETSGHGFTVQRSLLPFDPSTIYGSRLLPPRRDEQRLDLVAAQRDRDRRPLDLRADAALDRVLDEVHLARARDVAIESERRGRGLPGRLVEADHDAAPVLRALDRRHHDRLRLRGQERVRERSARAAGAAAQLAGDDRRVERERL